MIAALARICECSIDMEILCGQVISWIILILQGVRSGNWNILGGESKSYLSMIVVMDCMRNVSYKLLCLSDLVPRWLCSLRDHETYWLLLEGVSCWSWYWKSIAFYPLCTLLSHIPMCAWDVTTQLPAPAAMPSPLLWKSSPVEP